jgi:hypothetical protein
MEVPESSWAAGQEACRKNGLEMATVHSLAEIAEVLAATGGASAWLGASDQDIEGAWTWADASPFLFSHWNSGEPNGGQGESCMQVNRDGSWNDLRCTNALPVLCMQPFRAPRVDSSFPAFTVSKIGDQQMLSVRHQWNEVEGWTAAGYSSLARGFELDEDTGRFTAHLEGIYFASASIALADAESSWVSVGILINGEESFSNGCSVLNGGRTVENSDFVVSCLLKLDVADYISVQVYPNGDNDVTVLAGSGFSAVLLSGTEFMHEEVAFAASHHGEQAITASGWTEVTRFRTDNYPSLFAHESFDGSTGRFTASESGTFLTAATIRFDGADDGYFGFGIMTNGRAAWNSGLASLFGDPDDSYADSALAGVRKLAGGDFLSVFVHANADEDYKVSGNNGGFSAALMGTSNEGGVGAVPGVSVAPGRDEYGHRDRLVRAGRGGRRRGGLEGGRLPLAAAITALQR